MLRRESILVMRECQTTSTREHNAAASSEITRTFFVNATCLRSCAWLSPKIPLSPQMHALRQIAAVGVVSAKAVGDWRDVSAASRTAIILIMARRPRITTLLPSLRCPKSHGSAPSPHTRRLRLRPPP